MEREGFRKTDAGIRCPVVLPGSAICGRPVDPEAPIALCTRHLLEAYDWVAGAVGVTDVLPSPCLACGSRLGVRYPSGWLCAICEWKVGELPDEGGVLARVDVVYYIRSGDRVKIGTSANPRGRLAQLSYDELLGFELGDRQLEQKRHAQFAAHRFPGGEWFQLHDELAAHIAEVSAGVEDPWARYHFWVSRQIALHG